MLCATKIGLVTRRRLIEDAERPVACVQAGEINIGKFFGLGSSEYGYLQ